MRSTKGIGEVLRVMILIFERKRTEKKWAVWLKSPDAGPQQTLEYLSRYVNSVAISESRILEITDESIRIQYKNYAKENAEGLPEKEDMTLTDEQFFKRFLIHVLP